MAKQTPFEQFVSGYLECAAWADAPEGSRGRFTRAAIRTAEADCREFIQACGPLIEQAADLRDWEHLGHDFWLSRKGHGVGFGDRDELQEIRPCARVYGVDRNGRCYVTGAGFEDLAHALHRIAYGGSHISRFESIDVYASCGWLYFS